MNLDSQKHHYTTGLTIALIIVLLLSPFNTSFATVGDGGTANFSWLPNTESDLAGYKIHYGTNPSGPYNSVIDAGNPPPVNERIKGSVSGLTEGVTYYFVATAYNTSGLESDYSSEVVYTCPAAQPDTTPPIGTIIIADGVATTPIKAVILTLSASDTDDGTVTEMKFSNDSVNWSSPELYNTSKNWILSGEIGLKTVYVQFKDNSDNWSPIYSDSIELINSSQTISPPVLRIKSIGNIHY